jgi:hypothetical protein
MEATKCNGKSMIWLVAISVKILLSTKIVTTNQIEKNHGNNFDP